MTTFNPWFPFLLPKPRARVRLFCFSPSGGGATLFRNWRDSLPDSVDVYAVQLPGREGRIFEKPVDRMTELVPLVTAAMRPHIQVPFAIFGHSMGGVVGFEIARQLRRDGVEQPFHLFISAARPPHVPDADMHHALTDVELLAELRKMDGYRREVLDSKELVAMLLPIVRADAALTETYCPEQEPPLSCGLTIFAGRDDKQISVEQVGEWNAYATASPTQVLCPGGHNFLTTARSMMLATLASQLEVYANQPLLRAKTA